MNYRLASAVAAVLAASPTQVVLAQATDTSGKLEEVIVTAKEGQLLIPLPEGSSYMGFIFARAASPAEVEAALREAHGALRFDIATVLPTLSPSS